MVNSIEHTRPPMVVSPANNVIAERKLSSNTAAEHAKDTVFLENRKEIKARKIYKKGLFIDYYI